MLDQQFTGNYELISSVSDKAVDLNNDGSQSTNLLNENSMILLSNIAIRIPYEKELFLTDKEFVFSELWPTENDLRLKNKDVIKVDKSIDFNPNYDIYGNTLIGEFTDDFKSATFRNDIANDGKNTLIELKSIDFLENETIRIKAIRKLYGKTGWETREIESVYKIIHSQSTK